MKLFIDDERFPNYSVDFIARSSDEAIHWIIENGMPSFISFDHDLGGQDTAIPVINFIIDSALDHSLIIPEDFTFRVHSQNPIGKANIEGKLQKFLDIYKRIV